MRECESERLINDKCEEFENLGLCKYLNNSSCLLKIVFLLHHATLRRFVVVLYTFGALTLQCLSAGWGTVREKS